MEKNERNWKNGHWQTDDNKEKFKFKVVSLYIFKQGSRLCVCHWVGFPVNVCWMINECSGPEWKWAKVCDLFLLLVIPHFWHFSPHLASFFNLKTLLSIGMNVCVLWKLNWTKVPFEAELFCNIWRKYFAYDKDIMTLAYLTMVYKLYQAIKLSHSVVSDSLRPYEL